MKEPKHVKRAEIHLFGGLFPSQASDLSIFKSTEPHSAAMSSSPSPPVSPKSLTSLASDPSFNNYHLLMVGGGPRSIIQVNSEIAFMLRFKDHFDDLLKLGATYDIHTTIVEKQPFVGLGAAYNAGQTGMMNSGIEDDISFPLQASNSGITDFLDHIMSYKKRYDWYIGHDTDAYFEEIKKYNLPGAVLFKRSVGPMSCSREGNLDHEGAFLMRRTVGEEEYSTFQLTRKLAESLLPFYSLDVLNSTSCLGINIRKDGRQIVTVQNAAEKRIEYISADQVRLNTGTVSHNPISDPAIQKLMFCRSMNVDHFREYCLSLDLLGPDHLMKPGLKVISGGMGLSGLDQISVLDGVMRLFEEDESHPLGYKVTNFAKHRYQNSITLISRTAGKTCYPRHTFTPEWKQNAPVMARTEHLHALFLHNYGEEVFGIWYDILAASVARAMVTTPDRVCPENMSTETSLRLQFQETTRYVEWKRRAGKEEKCGNMSGKEHMLFESTKTLYGAWRQAALSLIFGYGIETDIEKATERMESRAPLTWKGRQVWLMHRAQISTLTDPAFASKTSNIAYLKKWEEIMRHVTSSPVEIHSMFHLLIDAGIAKYVNAPYSEVHCDPDGQSLELKGDRFDAFLVSPTFARNGKVIDSLTSQVKPYHKSQPSFGTVGKFRRFVDRDGDLTSIEDNGLGGRGFNIQENGVNSRVGSFAVDLNNRASGTSVASSFTLRRMALAHLKAAGIDSAEKTLDAIYESSKPDKVAFDEEVRSFEKSFTEAHEIWAYLRAIKVVAGKDSECFMVLYDNGLSKASRREQIHNFIVSGQEVAVQAAKQYLEHMDKMPTFEPASRDEYYARFVDTCDSEDAHMYNQALQLAKKHLS